ncbi:MAG: polysaccharide biosynthesis protein [Eubacteriales bacterium]|nr:polysaccharide biosynthesis protein [Eubacteriales bacterium]
MGGWKKDRRIELTSPAVARYFVSHVEVAACVRTILESDWTPGTYLFNPATEIEIGTLAERYLDFCTQKPSRDSSTRILGLRAGEKMHEDLINPCESSAPVSHSCIYEITQNHFSEGLDLVEEGANEIMKTFLSRLDPSSLSYQDLAGILLRSKMI